VIPLKVGAIFSLYLRIHLKIAIYKTIDNIHYIPM
jgi:hypothetical protein